MNINGIVVFEGIGLGKVMFHQTYTPHIEDRLSHPSEVEAQLTSFKKVLQESKDELNKMIKQLSEESSIGKEVLLTHLSILNDEVLKQSIIDHISAFLHPSKAVFLVFQSFIDTLNQSYDVYLRARTLDLEDVKHRLLKHLDQRHILDISSLEEDVILISLDLLPSVMMTLDVKHIKGIITFSGSHHSHTSIIAKSLSIPCIVGVKPFDLKALIGIEAMMDTSKKEIIPAVDHEVKESYKKRLKAHLELRDDMKLHAHLNARTRDGFNVNIHMNASSDVDALVEFEPYVDGIGLLRSEYMYMTATEIPSFENQKKTYLNVLNHMKGKPVTLRTLDIGSDKHLPYFPLSKEDNPALGMRGVRLTLLKKELLYPQIKAALIVNQGQLKLMIPMVSTVEDIHMFKSYVEEISQQLKQEGQKIKSLKLGVMIETPSAALMIKDILNYVDFVSVGTNDLTQYLLGVDRNNSELTSYYKPYHPVIFRLLKDVIDACKKSQKEVSICGELAGDPNITRVLLGLGYETLSMSFNRVGPVKKIIRETTIKACVDLAKDVLSYETEEEVLKRL